MRKTLKKALIAIIAAAIAGGGAAYARSRMETIQVSYNGIKVYKDNVLCELKDSNGSVIEPFIYNGTTYMPVRGTANLAGMEVTWDGETQSVHLWDEMVPSGTFLLDVCEPYSIGTFCVCKSSEGKSFKMSGKSYSNGLYLNNGYVASAPSALFNIDGKFSSLECTIGHCGKEGYEQTVTFVVDGRTVKTFTLEPECLPKQVSVPLKYGLQLKITSDYYTGIGNITVE